MKKIIVLMGKSGTGKDSLIKLISKKYNIPISVSYTTRPMREGEIDGVDYHFISEEDFMEKNRQGFFLESTFYKIESENRVYCYGTAYSELLDRESDYVLVILNPYGILQLKRANLRDKVKSILLKCDDKTRMLRVLNRDKKCNIDEVVDRYIRDKTDFDLCPVDSDYIVDNSNEIDKAMKEIDNIINEIIKEGE